MPDSWVDSLSSLVQGLVSPGLRETGGSAG